MSDITINNPQPQSMVINTPQNFLTDPVAMKNLLASATHFSNSTMIPKDYQGNVGSCLIACELAARVNLSPLMVMQQLAVVNGRPSWSGQACTALINQSRRYDKPLKIVLVDKDGNPQERFDKQTTHGAYAVAFRDSEAFYGTTVTWDMVEDEGWNKDKGSMRSKWNTFPEQMFKYRASTFFAREHCPDILMGCMVEGEMEDISIPLPSIDTTIKSEIQDLNKELGIGE